MIDFKIQDTEFFKILSHEEAEKYIQLAADSMLDEETFFQQLMDIYNVPYIVN
jgi:hypothetical protein